MKNNKSREFDAVLGNQSFVPVDCVILGGIEGVKSRLASQFEETRIAALYEALKYGEAGLFLILQVWKNELGKLKWEAYSLLCSREEQRFKEALKEYNPWLNMTCLQTWQQNSAIKCITLSQDGDTLVSGSNAGIINVWDMQTKQQKSISMEHLNTSSLAIASNGITLISRGGDYETDNIMKVWNLQTGECEETLDEYGYLVSSLIISPNGKIVVCGSVNNKINFWDLETKQIVRSISTPRYLIQALAISNDGKILVSGSNDKNVKVWNFETGELLHTFKKHADGVESVAISPDGQTIVSSSKDKTAKVWNVQTKKLQFTLEGHTGLVYYVAISPDGNYIFSCGRDKTIRVWNLHTGECQHILTGHTDWVYCLAVSPDGRTLLSSSRDKTIKVWGVE